MFWRAKPTIDEDDEAWQLECWQWLLENFGGLPALCGRPTLIPSQSDFPPSGRTGMDHASFVFGQVAARFPVDPEQFDLVMQQEAVSPQLGPLAHVVGAPQQPLGTWSVSAETRHRVSFEPALLDDLAGLIATFAHEICHPLLLTIAEPPPGGEENEEFATDLATVFFGFGLFGGNQAFVFQQFTDSATGTQGWSAKRSGYLTQNEWGFALAVRAMLTGEDTGAVEKYAVDGLKANFDKNFRYLSRNPEILQPLLDLNA